MIKLYAYPHDGVTDIYYDEEMKFFFCRDPYKQYRKSKKRTFNCFDYYVEILPKSKASISEHIRQIKKDEESIMRLILQEQGGSMGGMICAVVGDFGKYIVESIFMDKDNVKCHINVEGLGERDILFNSRPIWVRMKIIYNALKIANMIK